MTLKIITRKKPDLNSWRVGKRKSMILKELKKEKMKFWEICFFITNSTNLPRSMNFLAKQHLQTHNNFKDWNNPWQKLKLSLLWSRRTTQPHQHLSRQNQSKSLTIFATKSEKSNWKRQPASLKTWNNCKTKANIWLKICWKLSLNTSLLQKKLKRTSKNWKHSPIVILSLTSVNQPVLLQEYADFLVGKKGIEPEQAYVEAQREFVERGVSGYPMTRFELEYWDEIKKR